MRDLILPFQGWRLTFFQAVVIAVFGIFIIRLYNFQITRFDEFNARADDNRIKSLPIASARGAIFDRYDRRMAFNVPAFNVTIIPADLPANDEEELAVFNRLSALIEIPATREIAIATGQDIRSIEELVREGEGIAPFQSVLVGTDVPQETAMQILEERIYMPGVDVETVSVREYPQFVLNGNPSVTASHLVGYLGPIGPEEAEELLERGYNPAFDRIGYEGIERFLEEQLSGVRGERVREVDVAGEEVKLIQQTDPIAGENVRLTIDTELQAIAEDALVQMIQFRNENPASSDKGVSSQGVVIAMVPDTGEILAMVSWPTYDNTRFARAIDGEYYLQIADDPSLPLVNNAIKGLYPPGSVWKLVTAAGVLEENVIAPQTELFDEGQLIVENRYAPNDPAASQRFVCWLPSGHGLVNMVEGIAWSCDVYFYQVGGGNEDISPQTLRSGGLGIQDLFRYATATGFGSELGVELPFEVAGRFPDPDWKRRNQGQNWSTGDTYNAAFGQGYINVTPLQLINGVASLINGGTLYQPTIIHDILDEEGNVLIPFEPKIIRDVDLSNVPEDEPLKLLLLEDMLLHGENSLSCLCESPALNPGQNNPYYNPARCDPEGYRNTVDVNPDIFINEPREYTVHIPQNYSFNGSICQPVRFRSPNNPYQAAFVSEESLDIVREGMRAAVYMEGGTASTAVLDGYPDMTVAGKTGTAEYCDNIARPLGYCIPGQWPAHAWYVGFAPYDDPEIIVISFIYNGGEGSRVALPVVKQTMEAYFDLKEARELESLSTTSQ